MSLYNLYKDNPGLNYEALLKREIRLPYCRWSRYSVGNNMTMSDVWLKDRYTPLDIKEILQRDHLYMSVKQVPSCATLRAAGSPSVWKNLEVLMSRNFPLEGILKGSKEFKQIRYEHVDLEKEVSVSQGQLSFLSNYMSEVNEYNRKEKLTGPFSLSGAALDEFIFNDLEDPIEEVTPKFIRKNYSTVRISYDDPFLVMRAKKYALIKGHKFPTINVWQGDVWTLHEPIPLHLLPESYNGKRGIPFEKIQSIETKMELLLNRTHWGNHIRKILGDKESHSDDIVFCKKLKKRLRAFLEGLPDPEWRNGNAERIYGEGFTTRDKKVRASRLLAVLITADGMFNQRIDAFAEEVWTWDRYDRFTLGNIYTLLSDEFLDGTLTNEVTETIVPFYMLLKKQRKIIGHHGHVEELSKFDGESGKGLILHPWLEQFRPLCIRASKATDEREYMCILASLEQTRGCGLPNPLTVLLTKIETIDLLSKETVPLTKGEAQLIRETVDEVLKEIPDEALTGLQTSVKVSITTAACYEHTQKENGTLQAIADMVFEAQFGRKVKILNLDTGEVVDYKTIEQCTTGEYVFWRSLEEVLSIEPYALGAVKFVMVKDPGKARSVTKGRACLKIVYDVINKICSKVILKAYPSSESGMGKANHSWNVYKSLFQGELYKKCFDIKRNDISEYTNGQTIVETKTVFKQLYSASTDFSCATDEFHLEVASIIGNRLMEKVGIPKLLQGIVNAISYRERYLFFEGDGPLANRGTHFDEKTRYVTIKRGLLMGDPLTKSTLHILNMAVRKLSSKIRSGYEPTKVLNWMEIQQGLSQEALKEITEPIAVRRRF